MFCNNSISAKNNFCFNQTNFWFELLGLKWYHEIIYLCLLPTGLIRLLLNIFALIILRGDSFKLPIFYYLRVYAFKSSIICLITSTLFVTNTRRLFSFTNSMWTMVYSAHIQIPIAKTLFFYEACLDIVLSFDRAVMFSSGFRFFKKIKPSLVCLILLVISIVISCPFWLLFKQSMNEFETNQNQTVLVHRVVSTKLISPLITYIVVSIVDVFPFLIEIPLNAIVMILLKRYLKRKFELRQATQSRLNSRSVHQSKLNSIHVNRTVSVYTQDEVRTKKMEIKVTFLVVIMSIFSIT
jgi:hypothetical protein